MNRILMTTLAAAALALAAGCSDSGHSSMPVTVSTTPAKPADADAYTQSVQAVLGMTSEASAPIATEGLPTVVNDTGLPIAVY